MGLIPLQADPRLFEYPSSTAKDEDEVSDQDTLRYELKVTCTWNTQAPKDARRTTDMYKNSNGRCLIKFQSYYILKDISEI